MLSDCCSVQSRKAERSHHERTERGGKARKDYEGTKLRE